MGRALLVPLVLVGCGSLPPTAPPARGPAAAPVPDGPLFGIPGEAMTYEVRLRGLRVARLAVAVGDLGWVDGHRAIIVRSHGHSDGLLSLVTDITYDLTTTLDLDAGHPVRDLEQSSVVFEGKQERTQRERRWSAHDIAEGMHDLHSASAALRGWHGGTAPAIHFDIAIDDATIDVAFEEAGRDMIEAMPAVRYAGTAHERFPFSVWVSDDAARVPLGVHARTKWGDIDAALVDYDPSPVN